MHYSQSEKYEIIQLVEQSDLGINRILKKLKINKTTGKMMILSFHTEYYFLTMGVLNKMEESLRLMVDTTANFINWIFQYYRK